MQPSRLPPRQAPNGTMRHRAQSAMLGIMIVPSASVLLTCVTAATVVVAGTVHGQQEQPRTFGVSGTVTDAGRVPLFDVEIMALDSGAVPAAARGTKTNQRGQFDLGLFPHGRLYLRARRIGYEPWAMLIQVGEGGRPTSVEIVLLAAPTELENVTVTAASPPTKLRGFYERSRQKRTFARFFDVEQIRRMNPRTASELLRSVPGVSLESNQSGGNSIRIRGCQPMVWLDDQRVPGAELDDLIVPSEIAAIEFYPSSAGIPAQYLERGNRLCGLILVWTRSG